jgi:hypothetical protein
MTYAGSGSKNGSRELDTLVLMGSSHRIRSISLALGIALVIAAPAQAQVGFDVLGARALGMGGAFVAVADDPVATHWNPAGLIEGPMAGLTIGWDSFHFRDQKIAPSPGIGRLKTTGMSFGSWPVGVSIQRFTAAGLHARNGAALRVEALRATQVGFTVLQSIGDFVVAGATFKYVRGAAANVPVTAANARDALESGLGAAPVSGNTFDLDAGVLLRTERLRAGISLKNLRRPGLVTIGGSPIHLERRVRIGFAALPRDGLTLAIDVDLDTADPLVGLRQTIALGGETRLGSRLALRGGFRFQRGKASRPIGALGGSVRLRQGLWLDGYVTPSRATADRGFGFAMRVGS